MDGIQIVLLIIIVLALIAIYYSSTYNKIKTEILKINSSESEIDTLLRNKYDLIAKVIVEINLRVRNVSDLTQTYQTVS